MKKLLLFLIFLCTSLIAQTPITGLPELATAPASNDVFVVVDVGAGVTKKITVTNLLLALGNKVVDCTAPTLLTISAGSITIPSSGCYRVDTEAAAASDDLDSLVCAAGVNFALRAESNAHTVVIKNNGSTIFAQADFSLDNIEDRFKGVCWSANVLNEESRANNGS